MQGPTSRKLSPELQAVLGRLGPLQDLSGTDVRPPAVQGNDWPGAMPQGQTGLAELQQAQLPSLGGSALPRLGTVGDDTPLATLPALNNAPQLPSYQTDQNGVAPQPLPVSGPSTLPQYSEPEQEPRKASRWRVIDGVLSGLTPARSLDLERARNARLDYADKIQAAIADGVTPEELHSLRLGMLPLASRGVDVSGQAKVLEALEQQAQLREFLQTVPEDQRSAAALDPAAFADWQRKSGRPQFFSVGGNLVAANPETGQAAPAWMAPEKAEPPTTDRVLAAALDKMGRGQALTPGEQRIVDRYISGEPPSASEREPTPTRILGAIQDKIARGVTLNDGEQQIYEDSKLSRLDPLTAAMLGGLPGVSAIPGAPAIPGLPEVPGAPGRGAASQRGSGQVSRKGGVYYPQSAEDMAQIPKGARYVNPANGAVLVKAR